MKRSQAFPSKYMSKEDVEQPIIATIRSTSVATFDGDNGEETKPVLHFDEQGTKPMLLNFGNWTTCEELFGEDSETWVGKKIEIYKDPNVMYGKKKVGGLRLRAPGYAIKPSRPAFESFSQAADFATKNGVGENEIKAAFKERGLNGFSPSRGDSEIVYALIDAAAISKEEEKF